MWTRINDIDRIFGAMDLLRSRINGSFYDSTNAYGTRGWRIAESSPRTNLYDNGDHFSILAELPGLTKEDISIKIQGNYLELSGKRNADIPEGYKSHRVECSNTSFTRSFTLPADVDVEKVKAGLENGILSMTLPKAETAKARQITIN